MASRKIPNRDLGGPKLAADCHDHLMSLIPFQAEKIRKAYIPPKSDSEPKNEADKPKPRIGKASGDKEFSKPFKSKAGYDTFAEAIDKQVGIEESLVVSDFDARLLEMEARLKGQISNVKEPDRPDAYRTGICSQIFAEICALGMPFSHVLTDIWNELEPAIYVRPTQSEEHPSSTGKMCYFDIVNQQETDLERMRVEQKRWCDTLSACQSNIEHIEKNMMALKDLIKTTIVNNKSLRTQLALSLESLQAANMQVKQCQDNLLSLKNDLKDARAEANRCYTYEYFRERELEKGQQEKLHAEYKQLVSELQHYQIFLEAAKKESTEGFSIQEFIKLKMQMIELEQKMFEARDQLLAAIKKNGSLTPRPKWDSLPGVSSFKLSSQLHVVQIAKRNAMLSEKLALLQSDCTAAKMALERASEEFEKVEKEKKKKRKQKPKSA